MTLTHWSPARDLATLEIDRLNRMFNTVFKTEPFASGTWVPAVDIYETADHDIVFRAELPDMKRDAIKVAVENSTLTIEGERTLANETTREQYHRLERSYGTFRRSFTLPVSADASRIQAAYTEGVLTITVPQRAEAKPRQISVAG